MELPDYIEFLVFWYGCCNDLENTSADLEVPAAPALAPGVRVRVFGLQSAAGMKVNGLEGKLQSFSPETGRWDVVLDSGEGKAIKSENLEVRPGNLSSW